MRFKLALALLTSVVMFAYVSNAKQGQEPSLETIEEEHNIELTRQNTSDFSQEQWREWPDTVNSQTRLEPPILINVKTEQNYPQTPLYGEREPYMTQPYENARVSQDNYMTLTPTKTRNSMGNPIYELRLYGNGQLIATFQTVTGRANSQNRNRHQAGTEAPLPDGQYQVATAEVAGTHSEVGGRFLPIEPLFPTGRSALGIHYDPSFQKANGEDGTEGCIALTNKRDLDQVLQYVYTYQPQYLEVNLQKKTGSAKLPSFKWEM